MTIEISLHMARPEHVEAITRLRVDESGAETSADGPEVIMRSIDDPEQVWVVALRGLEVIGYAAAVPIDKHVAELDGLHIEAAHRGEGLGTALLRDLLRLLQERGYSAVAIAATDRVRVALSRIGVQLLAPTQSLGLATSEGAFYSVSGRDHRPLMGIGFLRQPRRHAIAWPVNAMAEPDAGTVADGFYAAHAHNRGEALEVLGDDGIITALMAMERFDLVQQWTVPFAPAAHV